MFGRNLNVEQSGKESEHQKENCNAGNILDKFPFV